MNLSIGVQLPAGLPSKRSEIMQFNTTTKILGFPPACEALIRERKCPLFSNGILVHEDGPAEMMLPERCARCVEHNAERNREE